jgi:hypothetical protein
MGLRPVKASNGQYWRAKKASTRISILYITVKSYYKLHDFDTALSPRATAKRARPVARARSTKEERVANASWHIPDAYNPPAPKVSMSCNAAGPSSTINSAGKMRKTIGKSILMGAF